MIDKLETDVDLLDRHFRVLDEVRAAGPIGIHKIANETGLANHEARYSLRILEANDAIEPTARGAQTTDATDAFVADANDRLDAIIDSLETMEGSE